MADAGQPAAETVAPGEVRIRRALLSVSDKRGLVEFARGLDELGVEIVSTGGTAGELAAEGIETRPVEDYTGFPEILDGRVKTLNPRIYAGLLAVRSDDDHVETLREHSVDPIDLVCVNLYPFERVSGLRGVEEDEVIENIDIGGPTLIRAAAKNHAFSAVVVTPESYDAVLAELEGSEGQLSLRTRQSLAMEAFAYTARYDAAICALVRRARGRLPRPVHALVREGARPDLRREPAPAGGVLRGERRAHAPDVDGVEAARQGALVQQPARPRLGAPAGGGLRAAGGGDHQAQQPLRRGAGGFDRRGLRQGARHRSAERLRRRVLLQPAGRPRRSRRG